MSSEPFCMACGRPFPGERLKAKRGRPRSWPGDLTPTEIAEAVARRRRKRLTVTMIDVGEDLGVSRHTLRRALRCFSLEWQQVVWPSR